MTMLVDLRRWRIEAESLRLDLPDPDAPLPHKGAKPAGSAEIILFPKIIRALAERPPKSLKRRFRSARPTMAPKNQPA